MAVSILFLIACFIVPLAIFLLMVTAIAEQLDERKRNERSERDASTPIDVLPPQSTPDTGVILEPPVDRSKWFALKDENLVPDLDSDLDSDPDSDLDSESDEAQDSFKARSGAVNARRLCPLVSARRGVRRGTAASPPSHVRVRWIRLVRAETASASTDRAGG